MLNQGQTVIAVITRIVSFGLFLEYDKEAILVLAIDAGTDGRAIESVFQKGESVAVEILCYSEDQNAFRGRITNKNNR